MILDDFVIRALLGGLGVAVVAGPLGCFVVWRRMAYFGDSLAHSALLGVALGFLLAVDPTLGILAVCVVFAISIVLLQEYRRLATDTLLGILSHAALSLGLVAISLTETLRLDLLGYLFGDILAVTVADIAWIYAGGVLVLVVLATIWRPLLAVTVHDEVARAEGVPAVAIRLLFTLLLALVIALSMKIIGILLITSLLIIPAAAARRFARTPEQMAVLASAIGGLSVTGGLLASLYWNTPSGPSVVVAAFTMFAVSQIAGLLGGRLRA